MITHISGGGKGMMRKGLQGEQRERRNGLPHGLGFVETMAKYSFHAEAPLSEETIERETS